jgi:gliding motility-associated-like protein
MKRAITWWIWAAWTTISAAAQIVAVNRGEDVRIQPGCLVSIHGDLWNRSGRFFHSSDSLVVFGDVFNDDADSMFSAVMNGAAISAGALILAGNNQNISTYVAGTTIRIPILRLRGTGVKTVSMPAYVNDTLDLHNRLLDTQTDTVYVLNRSTAAVQRADSGMVRSDEGGALVRRTNAAGTYLFPVGDVMSGQWMYRPLTVEPTSAGMFGVRMVLGDPTLAGYDRSQTVAPLCRVAPRYFHRLGGTANAALTGYYVPGEDMFHERWARWNATAWESFATVPGPSAVGVPVTQTLLSYRRPAWSGAETLVLDFGDAATIQFPPLADNRFCADDPPVVISAQSSPNGGTESFTLVGEQNSYFLFQGNFNPALYPPGIYQLQYTYTLTDDAGHVCSTSANQTLQIDSLPLPEIEFVGSDTFCFGETVTLVARPEGYEYQWTLGDGNVINGAATITLNRSENVVLRVTDPRSKCDAETSAGVFRGPQVKANFSPPAKLCSNHPPVPLEGVGTPAAQTPLSEYYLITPEGEKLVAESPLNPALYPPGLYTLGFKYGVRLGNTGRFCSDSVEKSLQIHAPPVAGYTVTDGTMQFCEGGEVTLEAQPAGMNYRWHFTHDGQNYFFSTARQLRLSLPTTATLSVTDPVTGCQSALASTIRVGADPFPNVDIITTPPPPFCDSTVTLTISPSSADYAYQWFRDQTLVSTEARLQTNVPGRYHAVVTSVSNPQCVTQTRFVTVHFPSPPNVEIRGSDARFCEGGGQTELSYEPQPGVEYHWLKDGKPLSEARDRVRIAVTEAGIYSVVGVSRLCPNLTDTSKSVTVQVVPRPPGMGFTYDGAPDIQPFGAPIQFRDTTRYGTEPVQRIWIFGDGDTLRSLNLAPRHVYPATGVYFPKLIYLTSEGCSWETVGRVEIDDSTFLWIPDVFTPNQSGPEINERFTIFSRGLKTFDIEIYNRWGVRVYSAQKPNAPFWDGTYQGQPCPEGVYTFRLSATSYTGRTFNRVGAVTLIR